MGACTCWLERCFDLSEETSVVAVTVAPVLLHVLQAVVEDIMPLKHNTQCH